MKIIVMSMFDATNFHHENAWAAISIASEVGANPILKTQNRIGLLELQFEDIDKPNNSTHLFFNSNQAQQILDFVEEFYNKIEVLLIHCHAGMSRSPAVAAAIDFIYTGNDSHWFKTKTPNMHVYRTILNTKYQ